MGRLKDLIINIGASTKNLDKELGKTRGKINGMTRNLQKVGRGMSTAITAPLMGIAAVSAKTFVDFEFQMAKVKAVSGATESQFQALQDQAKHLGATTMHTASSVSTLQLELSRLGFTATETQNATAAILDLATATDSDLGQAADVVGSTLRAFGQEASQAGHLSDVMAASFSGSALSMESFSGAMQYVAPIAKSAGVSIEETSAMMAVLANNGIRGSKAGRALRRILTEMATSGKPAMEALKDLAAQGLDLGESFDEVGRSAMSQLLILGDNISEIDRLTTAFENSDGSARKMAATMEDTTQGAIMRMQSALEGAALQIGENLAPHLEAAAERVAELAKKFALLSPETQASILQFAAVAAAIGPVLVLLPQVITSIGLLRVAFVALATNPVVLALSFMVAGFADLAGKISRAKKEIKDYNNLARDGAAAAKEHAASMKEYHDQVDATATINQKLADLTLPNVEQALGRVTGAVKGMSKHMQHSIGTDDLKRIKELEESYQGMELFGLTPLQAALQDYREELNAVAKAEEDAAGAEAKLTKSKKEFAAEWKKAGDRREMEQRWHDEFMQEIADEEKALRSKNQAQIDAYVPEEVEMEDEVLEDENHGLEKLGKTLARNRELAKQFGAALKSAVESGAASIASNMGSMIGNIAAGTASVRDLGNSMLTGLADMAINIGKIAISTGIALLGIKSALETLNPAVAIAAGIALVALGSMVKASLAKKAEAMEAPKLAKGGLAYGETLATIGDNPNAKTDPEVIAPLSKLQGMLGTTNVTGTIRGRDIVLTQERGNYSRRRKFGN